MIDAPNSDCNAPRCRENTATVNVTPANNHRDNKTSFNTPPQPDVSLSFDIIYDLYHHVLYGFLYVFLLENISKSNRYTPSGYYGYDLRLSFDIIYDLH